MAPLLLLNSPRQRGRRRMGFQPSCTLHCSRTRIARAGLQAQLEATAAGLVCFPRRFRPARRQADRVSSNSVASVAQAERPWYANGEYAKKVRRQPCGSGHDRCFEVSAWSAISGTQGRERSRHPYTLENPAAGTSIGACMGGCCAWGSHLPVRRPHTKCATWRPTHGGRPPRPQSPGGGEHAPGVQSRGDRRLERLSA